MGEIICMPLTLVTSSMVILAFQLMLQPHFLVIGLIRYTFDSITLPAMSNLSLASPTIIPLTRLAYPR